jgi:hypothetical protein
MYFSTSSHSKGIISEMFNEMHLNPGAAWLRSFGLEAMMEPSPCN